MPQKKWAESPEYLELFKKIHYDGKKLTEDFLIERDKQDSIKRKNLLRKIKKLEALGIINISHSSLHNKNEYSVNLLGLAKRYTEFLSKEFAVISEDKEFFEAMKNEKFSPTVKNFIDDCLVIYETDIRNQETFKQVFYKFTIIAYGRLDQKLFPEGDVMGEFNYAFPKKISEVLHFQILIYRIVTNHNFYRMKAVIN